MLGLPLDGVFNVVFYYIASLDRWQADCGKPEFLLLSTPVMDALLNEAFMKNLPVHQLSEGQFTRLLLTKTPNAKQ